MRIKIYTLLLVMPFLLILACTNSNEDVAPATIAPNGTGEGSSPICFSVSRQHIFDITRSVTSIDAFDANESIKVYVKPYGETTYVAYDYATQESGSTAVALSPITSPAYFPANDPSTVQAYAFYPATATTTFSVQDDQTSDANYKLSDLMFASNRVITKDGTDGNEVLTMNHQMAQLKITASAQEGSGLNIIGVTVEAKNTVEFTPEGENVITTTSSTGVITALTEAGTGYILIPPQEIEGVTVRIITGEGTDAETATYVLHRETPTDSFRAGFSYNIALKVTANQLGVTSVIGDWNSLGSVTVTPSGNLVVQPKNVTGITYDGNEHTPDVDVYKDGVKVTDASKYTVQYVNNTNAGLAFVIVAGKETDEDLKGCVGIASFTIAPAAGVISYASDTEVKTYTDADFTKALSNNGDGSVTYSSSNTEVATVNETTGEVTILKSGSSVITATVSDGANYVYANKTASYTLTVNKAAGSISFGNTTPSKTWSATSANNTYTQNVTKTGTGTVTYSLDNNTCGATISGSTITFTESGNVRVVATVTDDDYYTYATQSVSYVLTVNGATGNITLSSNSGSVRAGGSINITVNSCHGGTLSAVPASGAVDRVSITGPVDDVFTVSTNGTSEATVTLTVICSANEHYDESTATYTLTINPSKDIKMLPLYFVAQYNISNAAGTTFATSNTAGYYFNWVDAMTKFAYQSTSYDTYRNASKGPNNSWHLPIRSEWWSIVPGNTSGTNDYIQSFDSGSGTHKTSYITPKWGYDDTTKAGVLESSYWKKISGSEIRAIRFLGTDYCSAWKYEFLGNFDQTGRGYLRVSATLIDKVSNTSSAASAWYASNWNSVYFGNDESKYAVQRIFYALGYCSNGSGPTTSYYSSGFTDYRGWYWAATDVSESSGYILHLLYGSGSTIHYGGGKNHGFNVRLFRDN